MLGPGDAAIAFRRFTKWHYELSVPEHAGDAPYPIDVAVESLCAFVVRSTRSDATAPLRETLQLVDLGPIEPVEAAIVAWRDGLGVVPGRGTAVGRRPTAEGHREHGEALRRLVLDPLAASVAGASRWILVLDDVLHLVPFDALPAEASGNALLGDRIRIETRATVGELLEVVPHAGGSGGIVGIGDVRYDPPEEAGAADPPIVAGASSSRPALDFMRGSAWAGFGPLPGTAAEVEGLERIFTGTFGAEPPRSILRGAEASWARLVELSPHARWLHVATHGWFAPESVRSWSDPDPIDRKSNLVRRMSAEEQVKDRSPMLLCGLALAGANLPESGLGRAPGLITADELSTVDLTQCELAVLSACDTNVGERRGGQGVASLQRALQMAGARSVITSLWKVPDEATKDLMLDFYRRIWVEKRAKGLALWEAKMELCNAKDERGDAKYTLRDWGAWVLTGEPD